MEKQPNKVSPDGCCVIGCKEEPVIDFSTTDGSIYLNFCAEHYEIITVTLTSLKEPEEEEDDDYDGFLPPSNWRDN